MNIQQAKVILQQLAQVGVKTICLCPGARNAPFVYILSKTKSFETISFYDERSAGFFALGRAQRDRRPVVVLTTSGTAVSELLSPIIEAWYTKTPVIVLSADRPKRLRGSGAPQAIEQAHLFSGYVENSWDISDLDEVDLDVSFRKPLHINVCFDEPLLEKVEDSTFSFDVHDNWRGPSISSMEFPFLKLEKPLILVGALEPNQRSAVEKALQNLAVPLFLESASGLRPAKKLTEHVIPGGEKIVSEMLASGEVKSVLRLGQVPLGRYWRDLDQTDIPTVNISDRNFSGTEKSQTWLHSLEELSLNNIHFEQWQWRHWQKKGERTAAWVEDLLQSYPRSEPGFFKHLSNHIPEEDPVYLGNSLPVRLWDLVSDGQHRLQGNRGANGIDGQTSTAFGLAKPNLRQWVILGDLTALYDFNGLWVTEYLRRCQSSVNLIVVNNGGGQIFSRIFDEELFRNQHQLNFQPIAQMWGWNYFTMKTWEGHLPQSGVNLIEIQPDSDQTQNFWKEYDRLWR